MARRTETRRARCLARALLALNRSLEFRLQAVHRVRALPGRINAEL